MTNYRPKQNDKVIRLTRHQTRFIQSDAEYLAFIAGWGSGKTEIAICKGMELSDESPNNRGVICRKEFTDLEKSTIPDFEKYTGLKVGSNREAELPESKSVIMFLHFGELDVLKNMNIGWFIMEQGEEAKTDEEFIYLCGRTRRDNVKHYGRMVVANACGHNWIWDWFKKKADSKGNTILRLPHPIIGEMIDFKLHLEEGTTFECNPDHLPASYLANLAVVKDKRPADYLRFVLNSYDENDTVSTMIPTRSIRQCIGILPDYKDERRLISCDIAREGDDRTEICRFCGYKKEPYKEQDTFPQQDLMKTVGNIIVVFKEHKASLIVIDAIGVGAGVADRLEEQGYPVWRIISNSRSNRPEEFANLKSEIWWYNRMLFESKQIPMLDEKDLITELSTPKYLPKSNGVIEIEPKSKIKKELGKSPDKGDCFVNGVYAIQYVRLPKEPKKESGSLLQDRVNKFIENQDKPRRNVDEGWY